MKSKNNRELWNALFWGLLIFVVSLLLASFTFWILHIVGVNNNYSALIIGVIEGSVGALTGGFIIPQLKGSKEIEMKENDIHIIEFYHSFITYWLETDKMFIEHPECRKYFYTDVSTDSLDKNSDEYQLIMAFAEYFDDLFRYSPAELLKQLKSFSVVPDDQIDSYIGYMEKIMNRPAFKQYVLENRENVNSNNDNSDIFELKRILNARKQSKVTTDENT